MKVKVGDRLVDDSDSSGLLVRVLYFVQVCVRRRRMRKRMIRQAPDESRGDVPMAPA
jgi:hypothetical protein